MDYQKDEIVRFEIELKRRQTKLIQDYLFSNQLEIFENRLVREYFQYSERILCLNYLYSNWIVDFQRRHQSITSYRPLMTNYLENQIINHQEEEERLFHLV